MRNEKIVRQVRRDPNASAAASVATVAAPLQTYINDLANDHARLEELYKQVCNLNDKIYCVPRADSVGPIDFDTSSIVDLMRCISFSYRHSLDNLEDEVNKLRNYLFYKD